MKRLIQLFIIYLLSMSAHFISAQEIATPVKELKQPSFTLKTNILYDATATFNIGTEIRLDKKKTLTLPVNFNPWTFSEGKKLKHIATQPELRFWTCEAFNGLYWGIHAHAGQFNLGGVKLPFGIFSTLKDHRYEGYFYGGGVGLGYQWILNNRWNLELGMGVGYAYIGYDKFECGTCGRKLKDDTKHYLGVDRAAISLIYIIR